MEYLLSLFALAVGFLFSWFIASRRHANARVISDEKERTLLANLTETESQKSVIQETLRLKSEELTNLQQEFAKQNELSNNRGIEVAALKAENNHLLEKLETQKTELENLQKRLTSEFENIATKILKERSTEFSTANLKNLSEILNPLKERIQNFEKKVDETYDKELRDKISLREEVRT